MVAGGRVDGLSAVVSEDINAGDHEAGRGGYFGESITVFVDQVLRVLSKDGLSPKAAPGNPYTRRRSSQPSEEYPLSVRREADAMLANF